MTRNPRIRPTRRGLLRAAPVLAVLAILTGWLPGGTESAAAAATVTIAPAAGQTTLRAGDQIKVSWTGMPPGPVSIYQCADPAYLASQSMAVVDSCQMSSRVIGTTGADGTGTAEFQLWWQMKSAQTDTINCNVAGRCIVRVTTCPHTPERTDAAAVIPGMTIEEDPDTGDLILPARYRFKRPLPTVPSIDLPPPKPTDRPKVNGAGGTGIQLALESWRAGSIGGTVGVDATYAPRFFDEGYKFAVEGSNDFAIAAVPLRGDLMPFEENFPPFEEIDPNMSAEQQRAKWDEISAGLIYVPLVASPLDVIFDHAPFGVEHEALDLDGRSLARMFGGGTPEVTAIDSWNDAAITDQNAACPPMGRFLGSFAGESGNVIADESGLARRAPVRATNRSDTSESNFVLREWLRTSAPDLSSSLGPPSASAFKDAIGKIEVTGSKDMATSFSALNDNLQLPDATKIPPPGRIGYVDHAYAVRYADRVARLRNGAGEYVAPNALSATATLDTATVDGARGLVSVGDGGTTSGAYPMVQVYYAAISPSAFLETAEPERIEALRDFLGYTLSDEGQALATAAGYTPLTPAIRAAAVAQVAKIKAPDAPVPTTTTPPATTVVANDSNDSGATGGFGSVSSGFGSPSGSSFGASGGYSSGSGGSDYDDSLSGAIDDGSFTEGDGSDGSVTVEDPSAIEVLAEAVARPFVAIADVLTNPGRSPGLFTLMMGGGAACVVGPVMYRRRPKRAGS